MSRNFSAFSTKAAYDVIIFKLQEDEETVTADCLPAAFKMELHDVTQKLQHHVTLKYGCKHRVG